VSGERDNAAFYIADERARCIVTPRSTLAENPVLNGFYDASVFAEAKSAVVAREARLDRRLDLPRVLLINPCVLENFPVPRLCLSVGLVASYLRSNHAADVRVEDMQVGTTAEEIADRALRFRPEMVGMSISYGQKWVGLATLDRLLEALRGIDVAPLPVLGNIIPASYPEEFTRGYPGLVVAHGEGEETAVGLAEYLRGRRELKDVPGIAFRNESDTLVYSPGVQVEMEKIPLPALDTIRDIARCGGAVTLELSRGCQWNVCTFCPREHKSSVWKSMPTPQMIDQIGRLVDVCERFGIRKHIYLADEEFIGGLNDQTETERVCEFADRIVEHGWGIQFDPAARVDQVYSPKQTDEWHVKRLAMWLKVRDAGMYRLFMGLESGSNTQLKRYGKGIKVEHSIRAVRLLSALGIRLRFGFITFDPLMQGLRELKENLRTLGRTDAAMDPTELGSYSLEELFHLLTRGDEFARAHATGRPVYEGVSYMMSPIEVLIGSPYARMVENYERKTGRELFKNKDQPDTNMGRFSIEYVDPLVGALSDSAQRWIDRHFSVAYTTKSLHKVASDDERALLMTWMVEYRRVCYQLLNAFVMIFDDDPWSLWNDEARLLSDTVVTRVESLRLLRARGVWPTSRLIEECLEVFDDCVARLNRPLEVGLSSGALNDNAGRLADALSDWQARRGQWRLINDPSRQAVRPARTPQAVATS
ncbi:MAG: cobalamin-dependent protein, partial [Gemmatimonadetes bacterium]|nr:cobalamin-dependent protein [Gemmatimonadota bacterium]